jgi:hypothetical protein
MANLTGNNAFPIQTEIGTFCLVCFANSKGPIASGPDGCTSTWQHVVTPLVPVFHSDSMTWILRIAGGRSSSRTCPCLFPIWVRTGAGFRMHQRAQTDDNPHARNGDNSELHESFYVLSHRGLICWIPRSHSDVLGSHCSLLVFFALMGTHPVAPCQPAGRLSYEERGGKRADVLSVSFTPLLLVREGVGG